MIGFDRHCKALGIGPVSVRCARAPTYPGPEDDPAPHASLADPVPRYTRVLDAPDSQTRLHEVPGAPLDPGTRLHPAGSSSSWPHPSISASLLAVGPGRTSSQGPGLGGPWYGRVPRSWSQI